MQFHRVTTLFGVALVAASSTLQAAPLDHGTTSALAMGLSLDEDHATTGRDEVYIKAPTSSGVVNVATSSVPVGTRSYELGDLFGAYASDISVAAWSTGSSHIPGPDTPNAWPDLQGMSAWMMAVVSVTDETQGLPGSMIAQRWAMNGTRQTPGADLYGYYMSHSVGLSPNLTGTARLERRCEELGFVGSEDLDAIDHGMGVMLHAQSEPHFVFFYNDTELFFSLDSSCLDAVNQIAGTGGFAGGLPANASTIYLVTWQGNGWGAPTIFRDATALGLSAEAEIDALAVDTTSNNVVYSVKKGLGLPQLIFHNATNYGTVVEFVDGDGNSVSGKIGVKSNDVTDDVDGVDILDPEAGVYGYSYGTAQGTSTLVTTDRGPLVGLSMTRGATKLGGRTELHFQAVGWGGAAPTDGFVLFEFVDPFTGGAGVDLSTLGWRTLGVVSRTNRDVEVDLSIPIPTGSYGLPLGVRALVYDANLQYGHSSWATVFNL